MQRLVFATIEFWGGRSKAARHLQLNRFVKKARHEGVFCDMEVWAIVRRRVLTGATGKRLVCREYQLCWHLLEKILSHHQPAGYRRQAPSQRPEMEKFLAIIAEILEADKKAPKKQHSTAKRTYDHWTRS